jgi:hypothetical protein
MMKAWQAFLFMSLLLEMMLFFFSSFNHHHFLFFSGVFFVERFCYPNFSLLPIYSVPTSR